MVGIICLVEDIVRNTSRDECDRVQACPVAADVEQDVAIERTSEMDVRI